MIRTIAFSLIAISFGTMAQKKDIAPQWVQLFNGKDLKDWKIKIAGYPLGENYANTFRVTDQKLTVNYDGYDNYSERFGHIFYKQPYSYYLLAMEYRFTG